MAGSRRQKDRTCEDEVLPLESQSRRSDLEKGGDLPKPRRSSGSSVACSLGALSACCFQCSNERQLTPFLAFAAAAQIEVTLLLPHQSFVKLPHLPSPASSTEFLELPIPLSLTDAVHELRQMIVESPEAFWLGAFGFVPVVADALGEPKEGEEQKWGPWTAMTPPEVDEKAGPIDPKIWRLTDEGVLGDFADMGSVFGGSFERQKKGLKVVVSA